MKMSEELNEVEITAKRSKNLLKKILLIAAALIMAVVIVNSMVTVRTPILTVSGEAGETFNSIPACSCCSVNQAESAPDQIRVQALAYYNETFEEKATDAVVKDYGCHQEILILQDGESLRRLAYSNGVFSDLGLLTDEQGN